MKSQIWGLPRTDGEGSMKKSNAIKHLVQGILDINRSPILINHNRFDFSLNLFKRA
jgi:hypothetical protein